MSTLGDISNLADGNVFITSTPQAKKRPRASILCRKILSPCNLTSEFLNDEEFSEYVPANEILDKSNKNFNYADKEQKRLLCRLKNVNVEQRIKSENSDSFYLKQDESFEYCLSQAVKIDSSLERKKEAVQSPVSNFTDVFGELSPIQSNSISSCIIQKLKHNISSTPNLSIHREKNRASILFALEEAQKLQEQLSQSSVGPFYGLPSRIPELLKSHKGIDELYTWQKECLLLPAVRQKRNLVYTLPTSGGKTLVAEILIMKELLCHLKDAILVLPYISLVQEKVRGLAPFAVDLDFAVEEYAGIKGTIPPRKRRKRHSLYVCTIEKAHSLINSLIEAQRMTEIGLVVVDELHMIGEANGRGAALESLLSKVLFVSKKTQIIGMSATLSNMKDLQKFLNADIYEKDFRPVELKEYVKLDSELYELTDKHSGEWRLVRNLDFKYTKDMFKRDPDMITGLIMEVIPQNSCLVFCPTKKHCENVATTVCQLLPDSLASHKKEEKEALLAALTEDGNGNICNILKNTIKFGIAYHHSGLTMDERKRIEEAYLSGVLCCLTCTSTLAAGVNLPAKRVVLRAPYVGMDFITFSRYKQMVGRAGRAGIDNSGESILIIKQADRLNVGKLLTSDTESCKSNFVTEPERLHMLLLSLIGLGLANTMNDIYAFMDHTLAAIQNREAGCSPSSIFKDTVKDLCNHNLVEYDKNGTSFSVTNLGRAAFRGGVDCTTMEEFLKRLKTGLEGLVLHSHLHLLYLVTPAEFSASIPLAPDIFFQRYSALNSEDLAAAEQIGATECVVMLMVSGRSLGSDVKALLHHFYLTLILYDLWRQNSIWYVAQKYQVHRGIVQNLLNSASALGATLNNFCQELSEFWAYQQLLPNFVKQLSYCVTMELLPLMELPAVKRGRARQLYVAGFKSLSDIAKVDPRELVAKVHHLPYKTANQIVSAAKMILLEKADALKEEAELLIEEFNKNFSMITEGL